MLGKGEWVVFFAGPPFKSALPLVLSLTKPFEIIYRLKFKSPARLAKQHSVKKLYSKLRAYTWDIITHHEKPLRGGIILGMRSGNY